MWWMALAGAIAGQASYLGGIDKQRREIDRRKAQAEAAYGYKKNYEDSMYRLQRGEALETLGIQRGRLSESLNADVAGFNLGLEGQALQNQAAQASLADSAGMALAALGASGTRGNETVSRQIAYQEGQLGRQLDLQDRSNSLAMQSMTRQYTNTFADIGREIDSWGPGGWRTQAKGLSDAYAKKMHDLDMGEYANAYDKAGFDFLGFLGAGLGGAGTGAAFGSQIDDYFDQKKK